MVRRREMSGELWSSVHSTEQTRSGADRKDLYQRRHSHEIEKGWNRRRHQLKQRGMVPLPWLFNNNFHFLTNASQSQANKGVCRVQLRSSQGWGIGWWLGNIITDMTELVEPAWCLTAFLLGRPSLYTQGKCDMAGDRVPWRLVDWSCTDTWQ